MIALLLCPHYVGGFAFGNGHLDVDQGVGVGVGRVWWG